MVTPEQYLAAAQKDRQPGRTENEREDADKAIEIGEIYKIYEEELQANDAADFGDLILLPIKILERNPEIRQELQQRFPHILVDEYQDVNFASSKLLKLLTGASTDLWVVADQHQSIYRFRGAEPSNIERFETEFGGSSVALDTNYRSGTPVVRTFQALS